MANYFRQWFLLIYSSFELIMMDVQMLEMDGLEGIIKIRQSPTKQPAIIAITANVMAEDRDKCISAGMDDYLSKPLHIPLWIKVLKESQIMLKM